MHVVAVVAFLRMWKAVLTAESINDLVMVFGEYTEQMDNGCLCCVICLFHRLRRLATYPATNCTAIIDTNPFYALFQSSGTVDLSVYATGCKNFIRWAFACTPENVALARSLVSVSKPSSKW